MSKFQNNNPDEQKYEERILHLRRVSKKTSGGNYISFSALVAIGDGAGNVGLGIGRGLEVPPAIKKAIARAKKNMVKIPIYKDTIPHQVIMKFKAARLLLKPAPPGTGLKVGGVVRVILDIAGVNNASGKIGGSRNQITNAYAVFEALRKLKPRISAVKKERKTEVKNAAVEEKKIEAEVKTVESVEKIIVEEPKKIEKKEVKKVVKAPKKATIKK
ncbi:hypothetical protein BH09PAT1_BH09PAT1_0770 [soil metagenome]